MDYSLPGSSLHGAFQAKIRLVGLPFPSPVDLPDPDLILKENTHESLVDEFFSLFSHNDLKYN